MRKIGCISQTYGNSRLLEINCIAYDRVGTALRNCMDEISFTFHNSPQKFKEVAKEVLSNVYEKPVIFREYDGISYYDSILAQLNEMKGKGFTDILLIQDDQYGLDNNNNIEKVKTIVDFYRANLDVTFLHIFGREGYPSNNRLPLSEISYEGIIFNNFDSRDFKHDNIWSYNDGTYLASINFLLTLLSPNSNFQIPSNVWHLEMYCKMILDNNPVERWGVQEEIFQAANFHGKNISPIPFYDNLYRFFGKRENFQEKFTLFKTLL
jgi:hypothetical protein